MASLRLILAASFAAVFVVLAVLVGTGLLDGFDQYAVGHWMTSVERTPPRPVLEGLIPLRHADSPADVLAGIVTIVGHPVVSLVLVVALAARFARRREAIVGVFLLGAGVELALKHFVDRGRLHYHGFHLEGLDSSYPSGHALRSAFVFLLACALWPRLAPWLAAWAGVIAVALVVDGWHTPTDVAGGLLLSAVLFLVVAPQPVTASRAAASSTARSRSD